MERRRIVHVACLMLGMGFLPACSTTVLSVLPAQAPPPSHERKPSISIVLDSTTARLPLSVSGSDVAFGDVDRALARSVEAAVAAASPKLHLAPDAHLVLAVELIDARAEYSHERLVVALAARATLRHEKGNAYVAQTHAHSTASAHVPASHGAPSVLACTDSIASQLSGWLLGLDVH